MLKFCFSEKYYPVIFELLTKLRKDLIEGVDLNSVLAELPTGKLALEHLPTFEPIDVKDGSSDLADTNNTEPAFIVMHEVILTTSIAQRLRTILDYQKMSRLKILPLCLGSPIFAITASTRKANS